MLTRFFPFLDWFKGYSLDKLGADALSGLTVALVLIPQSMAYAQLAGMPSYYGLYASFLPPILASLFGSSRQLATGPVAVVSLMTSASLAPLAASGSQGYIAYAILLAFMVGVFQLALGLLRLGLVVNFLSHPVVNGFTNAAALIIATSQLPKIFGVNVETGARHYQTIINVGKAAMHYTHWPTFFMALFAFAVMYGLKRVNPRIPNVLVAVSLTTVIAWAIGFQHNRTVPATAIASPKTARLIEQFNSAVKGLPALAKLRTAATQKLDLAKSAANILPRLDVEHEISVLNIKSELLTYESGVYRNQLRSMLFSGVPQKNGSLEFFLRGKTPPGAVTDGRTWRLEVGNRPLKPDALVMVGGGQVVGTVPKGLPAFSIPRIDSKVMLDLFPNAAIISLLGFMEAISIAKAMSGKTGQRLDPNQELIGQGIANILGSMGKSFPTSGSFSRSAVNLQSGAVTGLSSVFTSAAVVVVLFFFTPLLYYLPQSVLAAVIMIAVIGLLNVNGFIHAWKAKWYDGVISILTFACTLAFAPHLDLGIGFGVLLSLAVFLYKSMRPTMASLARYDDQALRCVDAHGLMQCAYISLIRFDGPLFYANASYLDDQITALLHSKKSLKQIILASNGINDIDASGEETLSLLIDRTRQAGVDFSFSGVNEAVMKVFKKTHLFEKIGEDHIYTTMEKALAAIHGPAHQGGSEKACPLTTVCHLA